MVFIGEAEPRGPVPSEGSLEAEQHNVLGLPFVLVGNQFLKILLRHVGLSLVVHVKQQLPTGEQLVDSQSSGLDRDGHKNNIYFKK